VQYTSGSTSAPKGVELTHANVTAGLRAFARATELGPADSWGVWMPLFHDFGLVSVLTTLSVGGTAWVWPPAKFLRGPGAWLAEFGRLGLTHYSGPNFSFDLMLDTATAQTLAGVSLEAWRVAVNGAEQVNPDTVRRFEARFRPHGFRPETMVPGYGMAEATLAVTVPALGTPPNIISVDRNGLSHRKRVEPVAPGDPSGRSLVSVGCPVSDISLRIVDDRGVSRPAGHVGEIEISGPPVTRGYHGLPDSTHEGWLSTGDLGFIHGGELFIVGRRKDIVNVRGQKYHPEDLEPIVREVGGLYRGRCAVVGEGEFDERLAVVAETVVEGSELPELRREIRARLVRRLGISQIQVYLVAPRTVPVTSSGKTRRQLLRSRLEQGEVRDLERADR
jgi:acyl-CoA synthetase (AMP-forming)/AMP-acid ligase II